MGNDNKAKSPDNSEKSLRDILAEISELERTHCPTGIGFTTLDQANLTLNDQQPKP